MVKQISDNEIYLLIKSIKSVLWRAAICLSYTEDARCLKVNISMLSISGFIVLDLNTCHMLNDFYYYHTQGHTCFLVSHSPPDSKLYNSDSANYKKNQLTTLIIITSTTVSSCTTINRSNKTSGIMIIYFLIIYLFIYLCLDCEMYWSFKVKCKYKPTY